MVEVSVAITSRVQYQVNVKLPWYRCAMAHGSSFEHLCHFNAYCILKLLL